MTDKPRKIFPSPMDQLGWYFDVFVQWTGRTGPTRSHAASRSEDEVRDAAAV